MADENTLMYSHHVAACAVVVCEAHPAKYEWCKQSTENSLRCWNGGKLGSLWWKQYGARVHVHRCQHGTSGLQILDAQFGSVLEA